jgi:hypothetical protein
MARPILVAASEFGWWQVLLEKEIQNQVGILSLKLQVIG